MTKPRTSIPIDRIPDGVIVVETATGRILVSNPAVSRLFGYPHDGLPGMYVEDLMPEGVRTRHAAWRQAYATAPTARQMAPTVQFVAQRQDGSTLPVEIAIFPLDKRTAVAIIRDVSVRRDIETEKRQLERELRDTQRLVIETLTRLTEQQRS